MNVNYKSSLIVLTNKMENVTYDKKNPLFL